jgi:hypothetical protein
MIKNILICIGIVKKDKKFACLIISELVVYESYQVDLLFHSMASIL